MSRSLTFLRTATRVALLTVACAGASHAQMGDMVIPVGYAEAVRHPFRQTVELSGTIESRNHSVVAAEVAGLVVRLGAREGDRVGRGAPLVQLRRIDAELQLEGSRGELKEAEARLRLAETRRKRAQELFEEQVISRQQLDDALSEYEAGEGRVALLRAAVSRLENQLDRTTVRAPFAGVVVRERTAVGEWIDAGGPVAEMVDSSTLEVALEVPEAFYSGLEVGEEAAVRVDALGGRPLAGRVRAVVPSADPRARTFPVKIDLLAVDGAVGVGMLAKVDLAVGAEETAVLVPKDAIVSTGSDGVLYVIGEGDTVRAVNVTTGRAKGDWVGVVGEVAAGDRVVVQGNERLAPGQKVQPQRSEHQAP